MPLLFGKTGEIRCTKNGFFRTKNGKTETKNRIFRPDFTVSENVFSKAETYFRKTEHGPAAAMFQIVSCRFFLTQRFIFKRKDAEAQSFCV